MESYNIEYAKTKVEQLAFVLEENKHSFLKFVKNEYIPVKNKQA